MPLDPGYPRDRLALMLDDAQVAVLLTQKKLARDLTVHKAKVICLDDLEQAALISQPEVNPPHAASSANLAYVIFTSGSTGRPKGAMVPHRALVNHMLWMQERFPVKLEDAILQKTPISFDASVWEIFLPLMTGARLVLARHDGHRDPAHLVDLIRQERVTTVQFVPSLLEWFVEHSRVAGCVSLRRVFCGGEALPLDLCRRVFERLAVELVNLYGPTETAIDASYWVCDRSDTRPVAPIGRPVANTQLYVLDSQFQPVAVGVSGELFIGGAQVGRGYLNSPEMTAKKFIPDPFCADSQARLYCSGDLCRWGPDGNVEFLGRLDAQVKIRGYRIELGEVEAVLGGHLEVASCAVLAQDLGGGDKTLVAFVVGRAGAEPSVGSLRQWLGEKLPHYMVPSRFVAVPALPLTPNGKLDRKALEKLDGEELAVGTDYLAPRNELERALVEIWQAVLRREPVGIQDNFFELGGHSLLAVVICSQIQRRLGLEVPLRWVFEHPTIEGLARQLESLGRHSQDPGAIEKADRQKPLPMSFAQQGMWLLQQTLPDPATYNEPIAWHLSGQVDRERVRRSLRAILERHEVLRTALVQQGEDLLQQVTAAKEVSLPWQEIDLQAVPPGEKQALLEEQLLVEARRPFDLARAPLWRALWVALSGEEQVLALTFHHSIVEEWSMRLFLQELERLFAAGGQMEHAGLPDLPVQYADYAAWQRQPLAGELLDRQRAYWMEELRDLPPALELPADRARPSQPSGRGAVHEFQITGSVVTRLRELARKEGTTLFTVMLAAFQVWLHRYTGQTDMVVGTPITSRNRPELQSLLGFFLNTLPIRVRLEGSQSFREIVGQVRQTLMDAFSHADLPFEQMVELAVKEREPGRQPLYQALFNLLEGGLPSLNLDKAEVRRVPMAAGTSKYDLTLSIQAGAQAWDCQFEYATDLFTADSAARMARHLTELLRSITENSQEPISQLSLMPEKERHQVLVEWNQTERDYPRDKCVHQLFEEQVERTPEAEAVVFEGNSLTYQELNIRANRLAHHLRSQGVGPEVMVGICVERSLDTAVALLAVLKAGGALVPIDLDLPKERIGFIMADAQMPWLLTQSSLLGRLPPTGARRICLDQELASIPIGAPGAVSEPEVKPSNLAYTIYTSGSTGRPKGVLITQEAYLSYCCAAIEYWQFKASDRVLQFARFSFDVSIDQLLTPLLAGATVVMRGAEIPDPACFTDIIKKHRITVLHLPSVYWQQWVEALSKGTGGESIGALRLVQVGGDVMPVAAVRHWHELELRSVRLFNRYGPTETTMFSTAYEVLTEQPADGRATRIPIGRPVGQRTIYILDAQGKPVPIGSPGEIHIGGKILARGYLNRPELTAERFIPNPFGSEPGARLYRTGDVGRFLPDGNIDFLGRVDFQVKIRGYRIELGEVEVVLGGHPHVAACAVLAQKRGNGDKNLGAFVVGREHAELSAASLRQWLGEKLPDYMIPSRFVVLESLPLTPSGKVDRKALEKLEGLELGSGTDYVAPRNELERELVEIWQAVLRREQVGIQDNFFALGGHSLLAVRLAAEIDKILGHKLPIASLFQSPTIELLAQRLTDENWAPAWSALVPLQPEGSQPPLFFVHGWGGDVYSYLGLSRLLPPDQPSYGIQAVGLDGKSARHITVEDMAANYVKEIVSFQPEGPFYLAGYSMGGVIAFEVAQQLQRLGRRVALLALLDSGPTGATPWVFYGLSQVSYLRNRCRFHLRHWWELPWSVRLSYLRGRWASLRYYLDRNRSKPPPVTAPPKKDSQPPQVPGFGDYYRAVASAYRFRPYPGSVDVFVSDDANPGWRWYWRYLARGGVSFHQVPGRHLELITPNYLPILAKSLSAVLHRAQAEARATQSRMRPTHADLVS